MNQYFNSYLQKINTTFFLLLFAFFIHAQENEKQLKFEQKLNDFRYSLYEALDTIENFNDLLYSSDAAHPLVKNVQDFISENKQQIIEYREYKLGKYKNTKIDFDKFRIDSVSMKEINESANEFWDEMSKINSLTKELLRNNMVI